MDIAVLQLKKNQDRRLRAGHVWVYSNEVDVTKTPLASFVAGEPVAVLSHAGKWLGWGYVNPESLICARILSRDREHLPDRSLLVHRIRIALGLRQRLYNKPYYRLLHAETDGLPGLVVDRYGDYLVVQITTAGMETMRNDIVAALQKVLRPKGILLRNDAPVRDLEGLPRYQEVAGGRVPERVELHEANGRFRVSPYQGQKTGWFFDQKSNRDLLQKYVSGKTLLDCFSYVGAWAVRALLSGADSATCIDASAPALALAADNAALNGVADRLKMQQGDAFRILRELRQQRRKFDVVVVDPPAFIQRRKDFKEGALAYKRINEAAISLLARDGILVTASCSHHMPEDRFLRTVQQAARQRDRSLQLLETGQQGPDHPIHPAIPETRYLKAFFLRVLPSF